MPSQIAAAMETRGIISYGTGMAGIGTRIDETGTLIREAGGFFLRRDVGGRWRLDFHRVPVDHVEKRVRITGVVVGDGLVDVDDVAPESLPLSS